jgi:hypothetical protein
MKDGGKFQMRLVDWIRSMNAAAATFKAAAA